MFNLYPEGGDMPTMTNAGQNKTNPTGNPFLTAIQDMIKQRMEEDREDETSPDHVPRWGNTDDVGA